MIDGNGEGNGAILSGDNPFPLKVPGIERSGLKRPQTKEQVVDIATRISYRMNQKLFESIAEKMRTTIDALNAKHSEAIEKVTTELQAEIAELRSRVID